jgi:hypothetical protein
VATAIDKRYLELSVGDGSEVWRFQPEPLPLTAICELRRDPDVSWPVIEPVTGGDGFTTLTRHTRQALAQLDPSIRAAEFQRLGRMATTIPIWRLRCPDELDALPACCEAIVALADSDVPAS